MQVRIITNDEPAETIIGTYVDENEDDIQVMEWGEQRVISRDRISHYSITEGDPTVTVIRMTREALLDLLTTAAQVGRDDGAMARCQTRGDITEVIERRMRGQITAALAGQEA